MKSISRSSIKSVENILESLHLENSSKMKKLGIEIEDFKQDVILILLEKQEDITNPSESLITKIVNYYLIEKKRESKEGFNREGIYI